MSAGATNSFTIQTDNLPLCNEVSKVRVSKLLQLEVELVNGPILK
jgi:phosphoribosylformylglycinamidine (FGAM) synthase PurS component